MHQLFTYLSHLRMLHLEFNAVTDYGPCSYSHLQILVFVVQYRFFFFLAIETSLLLSNFHYSKEFLQDILIGQRMMTISTVGVPNTLAKLATHKLQSTLAIRWECQLRASYLILQAKFVDKSWLRWICFCIPVNFFVSFQFTCSKPGITVADSAQREGLSVGSITFRL